MMLGEHFQFFSLDFSLFFAYISLGEIFKTACTFKMPIYERRRNERTTSRNFTFPNAVYYTAVVDPA